LREIQDFYPGAAFAAVLSPSGEAIVMSGFQSNRAPEELLASIQFLKKMALQFATTLSQLDSPVIHVRGSNNVFSCYDIGRNLVAFYSNADNEQSSTSEADLKMRPLLDNIQNLVESLPS